MQNEQHDNHKTPPGVKPGPPPEIKLPFGGRKERETGAWVYDNRATLSVVVIIYLVIAIVFVSSRIDFQPKQADGAIVVDFAELDRLEQELRRAQELNRRLNATEEAGGSVRNAVSNENARPGQASARMSRESRELFNRSDRMMENMERNRHDYEEQLANLSAGERPDTERNNGGQDAKVEGRVTVSFAFSDPERSRVRLDVPAYRCRAGGRVVVEVTVNRNGDVTDADVVKSVSSSDDCMVETALSAARSSRFSVAADAPRNHRGTITYTFVPQ